MKKVLLQLLLAALVVGTACQNDTKNPLLRPGTWRAEIRSPGGELPFGLDLNQLNDTTFLVHVLNGTERLQLDTAHVRGDSLHVPIDIFDSELVAAVGDSTLLGRYTRYNAGKWAYNLRFSARMGQTYRFTPTGAQPAADLSGNWAVTFRTEKDSSRAVGVFKQQGNNLTGTFLTPTGDYRYLAGQVEGNEMKLSTFDGSHVYLFKANLDSSRNRLEGEFWSGAKGYKKWTALRDDKAALPDANALAYLKKGYDRIDFTFPDLNGKPVSLSDPKFRNKVVVVQIMGSWCPNCMDETNFLAPWYDKNKSRGVEIVGLSYEKVPTLEASGPKLERMKKRLNVGYDVLLAGFHTTDSVAASLPMIEKVLAFPTTIFIDKQGKVRRIHTGFSGPGTGKYYDEFVEEFNQFMDKLLAEGAPSA
jgi:thiol-disulfide isomerase/thioredoxin